MQMNRIGPWAPSSAFTLCGSENCLSTRSYAMTLRASRSGSPFNSHFESKYITGV